MLFQGQDRARQRKCADQLVPQIDLFKTMRGPCVCMYIYIYICIYIYMYTNKHVRQFSINQEYNSIVKQLRLHEQIDACSPS